MSGGRSLIQVVRSMTYLLVTCYQLTPELDGEFPPLLTVPYAVESATRRAGSDCYARVLKPAGRRSGPEGRRSGVPLPLPVPWAGLLVADADSDLAMNMA